MAKVKFIPTMHGALNKKRKGALQDYHGRIIPKIVCDDFVPLKGEKVILPHFIRINDESLPYKEQTYTLYRKIIDYCPVVYVDFDNGSPNNSGVDAEHPFSCFQDIFNSHFSKLIYIPYGAPMESYGYFLPIKIICSGTARKFSDIDVLPPAYNFVWSFCTIVIYNFNGVLEIQNVDNIFKCAYFVNSNIELTTTKQPVEDKGTQEIKYLKNSKLKTHKKSYVIYAVYSEIENLLTENIDKIKPYYLSSYVEYAYKCIIKGFNVSYAVKCKFSPLACTKDINVWDDSYGALFSPFEFKTQVSNLHVQTAFECDIVTGEDFFRNTIKVDCAKNCNIVIIENLSLYKYDYEQNHESRKTYSVLKDDVGSLIPGRVMPDYEADRNKNIKILEMYDSKLEYIIKPYNYIPYKGDRSAKVTGEFFCYPVPSVKMPIIHPFIDSDVMKNSKITITFPAWNGETSGSPASYNVEFEPYDEYVDYASGVICAYSTGGSFGSYSNGETYAVSYLALEHAYNRTKPERAKWITQRCIIGIRNEQHCHKAVFGKDKQVMFVREFEKPYSDKERYQIVSLCNAEVINCDVKVNVEIQN